MKYTITNLEIVAIVMVVIVSMLFGVVVGKVVERSMIHQKATEMGVGRYNPTNAVFEWVVDKK